MAETLYVVCIEVADAAPDGFVRWEALEVAEVGRFLTRPQVEAAARQLGATRRFAARAREDNGESTQIGKHFETADNLVIESTFTPWDLGFLTDHDMRTLFINTMGHGGYGSVPSPEPERLPIPVAAVVGLAAERFGHSSDIEPRIDSYVMRAGGRRYGDPDDENVPEVYLLPMAALGIGR